MKLTSALNLDSFLPRAIVLLFFQALFLSALLHAGDKKVVQPNGIIIDVSGRAAIHKTSTVDNNAKPSFSFGDKIIIRAKKLRNENAFTFKEDPPRLEGIKVGLSAMIGCNGYFSWDAKQSLVLSEIINAGETYSWGDGDDDANIEISFEEIKQAMEHYWKETDISNCYIIVTDGMTTVGSQAGLTSARIPINDITLNPEEYSMESVGDKKVHLDFEVLASKAATESILVKAEQGQH